jgi:hypothetical protein
LTQDLTAAYIGTLGVISVGAGSGDDYTAAALEPIIDQAIDVVNVEAGTAISHLGGPAGTKTIALSDHDIAVVSLMALILSLNAKLSKEETNWSIERRNNVADMMGPSGALTRRYEKMIKASGVSEISFRAYQEPIEET